jgi:hypothetical protein
MHRINFRQKRRGSPRLPWKRGPAAWQVAIRADEILEQLACCPRRFLSLRKAAHLLGISPSPLSDWIRREYLKRDGPRLQIRKDELVRFVEWLNQRAKPYGPDGYLERLYRKRMSPPYRFDKLSSAQFVWPKGRKALTPKELSEIIGCHPSLIVKAIRQGWVHGRRATPCRWEISRAAWTIRL